MEEIWKDIEGYEGLYQVSNYGKVINLKRNKILKGDKSNGRGYINVLLYKNGVANKKVVHRLVAQAFLPNLDNKPQVNHIDGNKHNNNINNLEWCTLSENQKHAFKTGLNVSPMKGKKHSYKTRQKIMKKIICVETQKKYNGLIIAEKETGIKVKQISKNLRGTTKSAGGFHWKYYTDN